MSSASIIRDGNLPLRSHYALRRLAESLWTSGPEQERWWQHGREQPDSYEHLERRDWSAITRRPVLTPRDRSPSNQLGQSIEHAPCVRPSSIHEKVEARDKLFAAIRFAEDGPVIGQIDADDRHKPGYRK